MAVNSSSATRRRSRLILLALFAIFFLPFLLAYGLNFFSDWRPAGTTRHGDLIEPPRPVGKLTGLTSDALQGRWSLAYLGAGGCDPACERQLYQLRQIRLAQGKNIDRVQRLLLWEGNVPDLVRQVVDGEAGALLGGWSQAAPGAWNGIWQPGAVYLIDPLGNLMMRYPAGTEAQGIVKDLERLLRISYVG